MEHISLRDPCEGNLEAQKKALEMDTSFHGELTTKPKRGLTCRGLMCERKF